MPEILTTNLGSRYFSAGKKETEPTPYRATTALEVFCARVKVMLVPFIRNNFLKIIE